jgi:hypothetical protein
MYTEHRELTSPPELDASAVADFQRDGFVAVRGLVPPMELAALRKLYDSLFERRAGRDRGDFFDMLDPADKPDQPRWRPSPRIRQGSWRCRFRPAIACCTIRAPCMALAPTPAQCRAGRRALTLEFAVHDPAATIRRDFEWNRAKWTARDERQATATPFHAGCSTRCDGL